MAIFSYKGLNKQGQEIKGTVNADNEPTAKQKIKSMKIMLLEVKEQKSKKKKSGGISFGGSGVDIQDISLMTRQLATLIKAKVQIVEAFHALQEQTENETLKIILSEIIRVTLQEENLNHRIDKRKKDQQSMHLCFPFNQNWTQYIVNPPHKYD